MSVRLPVVIVACALLAASTSTPSSAMSFGERLAHPGIYSVSPLWERLQPAIASRAARSAAPVLASFITAARHGVAAHAHPLPAAVRAQLIGFFPAPLLDRARFRIGWPDQPAWQARVFSLSNVRAVALDHVIVFRDEAIAAEPRIWAHELVHVQQFHIWGIEGFADRYIRDHQAVEAEAWDAAARYTMWVLEGRPLARTERAGATLRLK